MSALDQLRKVRAAGVLTPDAAERLDRVIAEMEDEEAEALAVGLCIDQPAEWINANHRIHWAQKAERTRAWREAARIAADGLGAHERVHITAWVHKASRRAYDAHNLIPTAKACIDGLVDAGLIPDDNNDHLTGPDMRMGETRPHAPGLQLTITPQRPQEPA